MDDNEYPNSGDLDNHICMLSAKSVFIKDKYLWPQHLILRSILTWFWREIEMPVEYSGITTLDYLRCPS